LIFYGFCGTHATYVADFLKNLAKQDNVEKKVNLSAFS